MMYDTLKRCKKIVPLVVTIACAGISDTSASAQTETDEVRYLKMRKLLYSYDSGIYLNGRAVTNLDAILWNRLTGLSRPGSYWLAPNGNYGRVGYTAAGNIYASRQAGQSNSHGVSSRPASRYTPKVRSTASLRRSIISNRNTLVVPGVGVLLPGGTSVTW